MSAQSALYFKLIAHAQEALSKHRASRGLCPQELGFVDKAVIASIVYGGGFVGVKDEEGRVEVSCGEWSEDKEWGYDDYRLFVYPNKQVGGDADACVPLPWVAKECQGSVARSIQIDHDRARRSDAVADRSGIVYHRQDLPRDTARRSSKQ